MSNENIVVTTLTLERERVAAVNAAAEWRSKAESSLLEVERLRIELREAIDRALHSEREAEATRRQLEAVETQRDRARESAEFLAAHPHGTDGPDDVEDACPPWLTVQKFCKKYELELPEGFEPEDEA